MKLNREIYEKFKVEDKYKKDIEKLIFNKYIKLMKSKAKREELHQKLNDPKEENKLLNPIFRKYKCLNNDILITEMTDYFIRCNNDCFEASNLKEFQKVEVSKVSGFIDSICEFSELYSKINSYKIEDNKKSKNKSVKVSNVLKSKTIPVKKGMNSFRDCIEDCENCRYASECSDYGEFGKSFDIFADDEVNKN